MKKRTLILLLAVLMAAPSFSCTNLNKTEQGGLSGAAIGALGGAGIAAIAGGSGTTGAVIGGVLGGVTGAIYGHNKEK